MNKLLATLVAGTFAVVASSAFAQGATAPADTTKMDTKAKAKYDEKAAQDLSRNSATDPAQAKANVDKSKMDSAKREKMPDLSKLTKEQKQELYRQLQKENTGG